MTSFVQAQLDRLYYAREFSIAVLAYLTLRIYGKEVSFAEVKLGKVSSGKYEPLDLNQANDVDGLLKSAQENLANAEKRRNGLTDKCKMLLTLGPLLLGVVGLMLPKQLAFESAWMRWLAVLAIACLFNMVVLLLVFFDVRTGMQVTLQQEHVGLDSAALKKKILDATRWCVWESDSRTDYLVELYRASRFCFLTAFFIVAGLVLCNIWMSNPSESAEQLVRSLRSEPTLVELLRGPKGVEGSRGDAGPVGPAGQKGDKGDRGKDADVDDLVTKVLADPRLQMALDNARKTK